MSQSVTSTGKTIEQAVESALKLLGKQKNEVDIIIKQKPENGVFGFFGKKDAIVEVITKDIPEPVVIETVKEEVSHETSPEENQTTDLDKQKIAKEFLTELFDTMDLDVDVETTQDDEFLRINLSGPKMGVLIGRRGQTLDAIQYLTSLVVNKGNDDYTRIIVDTENYRDKRKQTLEALADKMAKKAKKFRRRVSLEPMNPAERRIIHARLQDNPDVYTYSEGQDPYRRVVIQLNQN